MKMIERRYTVRFLTPAFLGDAEQNARWRTPPIKHALREWWRVAYAADDDYKVNIADMRREEGLLFGHAWLEDDLDERGNKVAARKSLVRLRLSHWNEGNLKKNQWPGDSTVTHPEVKNRENLPIPVGSALYLGYGPLVFDNQRRATAMKGNSAIQAGEAATLALAWPTTHRETALRALVERNTPRIERALWLMHHYGTLGGRSRNGWGSYELSPLPQGEGSGVRTPLRDWKACLALDWPHAIGRDDKGALIWQTRPHDDWKALMKTLAIIKIGLRTQFAFPRIKPPHRDIEPRHWLSYPITTHTTIAWDRGARLPNQLRFKVRRTGDGRLVGVIFHMPHRPPEAFAPDRAAIQAVWKCVHEFLDALTCEPAKRQYCEKADRDALARQKAQLDGVRLERITEE